MDVFLLLTKYMEHVKLVFGNAGVDHMASNDGDPTGPFFNDDERAELTRIAMFIEANPNRRGVTLTPPSATPKLDRIDDVVAKPMQLDIADVVQE